MSKIIDIKDGDSILVSRTDRLGDLVLALPFIESLKSRYPNSKIDVIASLYAYQLQIESIDPLTQQPDGTKWADWESDE